MGTRDIEKYEFKKQAVKVVKKAPVYLVIATTIMLILQFLGVSEAAAMLYLFFGGTLFTIYIIDILSRAFNFCIKHRLPLYFACTEAVAVFVGVNPITLAVMIIAFVVCLFLYFKNDKAKYFEESIGTDDPEH